MVGADMEASKSLLQGRLVGWVPKQLVFQLSDHEAGRAGLLVCLEAGNSLSWEAPSLCSLGLRLIG